MIRHKRLLRVALAVLVGILVAVLGYYVAGRIHRSRVGSPEPLVSEDDDDPGDFVGRMPPDHKPLPRERLRYEITTPLGKSGELVLAVGPDGQRGEGRAAYRVTASVATSPAVSSVYVVEGQITSLIDARTLLPIEYAERVHYGFAVAIDRSHKKLVYERSPASVTAYEDKGDGLELRDGPRSIPPDAHHFMSIPYYLRHRPMAPGDSFEMVASDRKRDVVAHISVLREEPVELPAGETRDALVIEVRSDLTRRLWKGARLLVWVDKAEGYPHRIDASMALGTITATLAERTVRATERATTTGDTPNTPGAGPTGQSDPLPSRDQ